MESKSTSSADVLKQLGNGVSELDHLLAQRTKKSLPFAKPDQETSSSVRPPVEEVGPVSLLEEVAPEQPKISEAHQASQQDMSLDEQPLEKHADEDLLSLNQDETTENAVSNNMTDMDDLPLSVAHKNNAMSEEEVKIGVIDEAPSMAPAVIEEDSPMAWSESLPDIHRLILNEVSVNTPHKKEQVKEEVTEDVPDWMSDALSFDMDLDSINFSEPPAPGSAESSNQEAEETLQQLDSELAAVVREETEDLIPQIEAALGTMSQGKRDDVPELLRLVHTLKGVIGMAGAMKTRGLLHHMEELMEEVKDGKALTKSLTDQLQDMFFTIKGRIKTLFEEKAAPGINEDGSPSTTAAVVAPKQVKVSTSVIDRMLEEIGEARLSHASLSDSNGLLKHYLRDLEENLSKITKLVRDLEMQAESQIQSRKAQLAEINEDFDPLEMDRFTALQESSRLLSEAASDILDLQRDATRTLSEQETTLAYQEQSVEEVLQGLTKTRLTPVDVINDRLHKVVLTAAKEVGKQVQFALMGSRIELDRSLLDRIVAPLEHILRNGVAHGIEMPEDRIRLEKPAHGTIKVKVHQEAGRAYFVVEDDGGGLNVARIKKKAIEKGLWEEHQEMDDKQAADMVCMPGFSTADAVSQIAGRGVGMDVVRNEILAMGGRFDMHSKMGHGLKVVIQLPTSIASASVMLVRSGGEEWAVPVEQIEDMLLVREETLKKARAQGRLLWNGREMDYRSFSDLFQVSDTKEVNRVSAPVIVLREGERRLAVEVSKIHQIQEVPIRALHKLWNQSQGIVGAALLPNGRAAFLVDPMRSSLQRVLDQVQKKEEAHRHAPLVLVVDDSITVRKATAKFLEKNGYDYALAKDGQEALEMLLQVKPVAMLLDVEMPRMDGFDCAKNVRENPKWDQLPIIMITSRTADKHRNRAMSLGVDEYLGKPFREDELLRLLEHYGKKGRVSRVFNVHDQP